MRDIDNKVYKWYYITIKGVLKVKVVSLFNLKGGVAKTISSVNIATILALKGKKVLLIDNDPQANSCINLNMKDESQKGIYELLSDKETSIRDVIRETSIERLSIVPSAIRYFDIQKRLANELNPYSVLRKKIQEIKEDYDYVIIDNHPSLSTMSFNGLVASDEVLVPLTPDNFALEGLNYLFDKINEVIEELNYDLKIKGVFITRYSGNTLRCREIEEYLKSELSTHLFRTYIRDTTKVGESTFGQALVTYDKKATATQDYYKLVKEVFNI
jgi:chromosome partitioning protein